jgi:methionine-rich copper-binding protein CopC
MYLIIVAIVVLVSGSSSPSSLGDADRMSSPRMPRVLHAARALSLGLLLLLLAPASAAAHAELAGSAPTEGQVVAPGDLPEITLKFSEDLAAGSKVQLVGPGIDTTAAWAAGDGPVLSITPPDPLPAGAYELRWTSVAGDGDIQRGIIHFTVSAATAPPSAAASPGASSAAPTTDAPTLAPASPVPSGAGGGSATSTSDVLIPVAALALLVLLGGTWLLRGRGRWRAAG